MIVPWLDASDRSGMPVDPRLWSEAPIASTYPACMAVKAAAEQGPEAAGRYLRALREGLMCFRRKLDTTEALVEEARGPGSTCSASGLAWTRTRSWRRSAPTWRRRARSRGAGESLLPLTVRRDAGAGSEWLVGAAPYDRVARGGAGRRRAGSASASRAPIRWPRCAGFGRAATVEVGGLRPARATRAEAELWRLAADWG